MCAGCWCICHGLYGKCVSGAGSELHASEVLQQAKRQIKGKVVDAAGETVIGANVLEKGTTNGVITDIDW